MPRRFEYASSPTPPTPNGSVGSGLSNFRYTGTINYNASNTQKQKNVGKFNVDLANPGSALGGTVDSAIGLASGLAGGALGAVRARFHSRGSEAVDRSPIRIRARCHPEHPQGPGGRQEA